MALQCRCRAPNFCKPSQTFLKPRKRNEFVHTIHLNWFRRQCVRCALEKTQTGYVKMTTNLWTGDGGSRMEPKIRKHISSRSMCVWVNVAGGGWICIHTYIYELQRTHICLMNVEAWDLGCRAHMYPMLISLWKKQHKSHCFRRVTTDCCHAVCEIIRSVLVFWNTVFVSSEVLWNTYAHGLVTNENALKWLCANADNTKFWKFRWEFGRTGRAAWLCTLC